MTPWVNGTLEGVGVSEVMRSCTFSPRDALVLICSFQLQGGRSSGLIRPLDESESKGRTGSLTGRSETLPRASLCCSGDWGRQTH